MLVVSAWCVVIDLHSIVDGELFLLSCLTLNSSLIQVSGIISSSHLLVRLTEKSFLTDVGKTLQIASLYRGVRLVNDSREVFKVSLRMLCDLLKEVAFT